MNYRIEKIRENEKKSHTKIYSDEGLYNTDSWLKKPIKTITEIAPLFSDKNHLRVLDLGCGVGRNSIYIAEQYKHIDCMVDCVDILEIAIEKLQNNARIYEVEDIIKGTIGAIEHFSIPKNAYDFIICVSSLEHVENEEAFLNKLQEIRDGIKLDGIVCLVINSEVMESNSDTMEKLEPQFEVNLSTETIQTYINDIFVGWDILKNTVSFQEYDIPRDSLISHLSTNVITYVGQKV